LNFEYYYARRITFKQQRSVSGLVVRLAVISIAIGLAVMEIALSVVQGFETKIQNKVVGFGSHIQIGNYFSMNEEEIPIPIDSAFIGQVRSLPEVVSISPYVIKWSILASKDYKGGIMLKGVDSTFDWRFFQTCLQEGRLPDFSGEQASREVLISRIQARLLKLKVGDKAKAYFFDDPIRRRPIEIVGIYQTGMEEFDNNLVICDQRMLQRIRGWQADQVTGYEINLTDLQSLDAAADTINQMSLNYAVYPITRLYPEIFDWLRLQHQNVQFILILMIIVAVINMTSVVLILIIERTRDIGILKALGLTNFRLQKMFTWNALFLILLGIAAGNLLGLGLLWSQEQWGWLKVDQENYFITTVPVAWVWGRFLMVNASVVLICTLFMLIPTLVVSRISPMKAIRFG
jgi:lipoprotein-releasing system permease protein